ncbi:GMC oxidoreductase [Desarmillaria tabescens]|uniref:GMC oxidoreductase n=1 Tax=Armillaria tabescens TaxID=1929756 RepID=A0AA39K1S0_ARMTA|nr:GMC oxidoreductase [Desarmillaria tabescens]KAK0452909.1 GMC oxidoreductase [Desarmillaria tabescens]
MKDIRLFVRLLIPCELPLHSPFPLPSLAMSLRRLSHVVVTLLAILSGVRETAGQSASSYTDPITGMSFQALQDSSTGFVFGLALPETIGTDFIGQMIYPSTDGAGWGGAMTSTLLLVYWANGDEVMTSFRETSSYASPSVYDGNVTLSTIPDGTYVNDTHVSLTFLCGGCITGDSLSFSSTDTSAVLGWGYSTSSLSDITDSSTALVFHSAGYGEFGFSISGAQTSEYDTWAALAESSSEPSSTASASGTATSTSTTTAPTATTTGNITYDAIIVGSGPAGIIVAERMAEAGDNVLLIERGVASLYSCGGERVESWNDTITVFDLPANGYELPSLDDTSFYCTDTASQAGCILGGSGMVNALMWVPPTAVDFENFPAGWNWDNVSASADNLYARNPGTTLPSADGQYYDTAVWDIASAFLANNSWTEVDAIASPSDKTSVYSRPPWNIQGAQRAGPVMTYLPLAQAMDNFELMLSTTVTRVVRNGSTITGVEIETDGAREIININDGGKVVLTAGAMSTPRILFNSGIGPSDQIAIVQSGSTSITLPEESEWIDLPVGEGIMDHVIFAVTVDSATGFTAYDYSSINSASANSTDTELYNAGSGILARSGQRLTFWTNIETNRSTRYIQGTVAPKSNNTITWKIYLTHGLTSNGTLGITSDGSTTLIKSPWLTTDDDKATITSFMETFIGYMDNSSELSITSLTGDNITAESLIEDYTTGAHWAASCKMGESNDGSSVVDTDTRVWGTDNLFIADASIHPDLPVGNIQTVVMIVAEKAAEKIIAYTAPSNSTTSSVSTDTETFSATASYSGSAGATSVESLPATQTSVDSSSAAFTLVGSPTSSAAGSSSVGLTTTGTSTSTAASSVITDANICWNNYNSCIAAGQPNPDWDGCTATKDDCLTKASYGRRSRTHRKRRLTRF